MMNEGELLLDKSRNLSCCLMNVGEVESTTLEIAENRVVFAFKAAPQMFTPRMLVSLFLLRDYPLKAKAARLLQH